MIKKLSFRMAAWAALLFSFSLSSCKKDNVGQPPPGSGAKLVSYSNADEKLVFEYNNDQSLRKVTVKSELVTGGVEQVYTVNYRADKKIDQLSTAGGTRIQLQWTNGELTGSETWVGNDKVSITEYQYLNGLLKSTLVKMVYGNDVVPFLKFSFIYDNAGNIGRTNTWSYNFLSGQLESTGHVEMEYDTKPSPFSGMKQLMQVFWQAATPNNVTRTIQYASDGQEEEQTVYQYTYNASQYPVAAQVTTTAPGQEPVNGSVHFTYGQ